MTEKFKEFVKEVNTGLIDTVNHNYDENYNIVISKDGNTLMVPVDELEKYYTLYTLGRKNFSQAVTRAAAIINKNIIQWYNLE